MSPRGRTCARATTRDALDDPAEDEIRNDGEQQRHHHRLGRVEPVERLELVDRVYAQAEQRDARGRGQAFAQPAAPQRRIVQRAPEERLVPAADVVEPVGQRRERRRGGLQIEAQRHRPVHAVRDVVPEAVMHFQREAVPGGAKHQQHSREHDHDPGHARARRWMDDRLRSWGCLLMGRLEGLLHRLDALIGAEA